MPMQAFALRVRLTLVGALRGENGLLHHTPGVAIWAVDEEEGVGVAQDVMLDDLGDREING